MCKLQSLLSHGHCSMRCLERDQCVVGIARGKGSCTLEEDTAVRPGNYVKVTVMKEYG